MQALADKLKQGGCKITSISPLATNSQTLVKIKVEEKEDVDNAVSSLRRRFPLSTVGLVDDEIQNEPSIHLLVPDDEEVEARAEEIARSRRAVRVLKCFVRVATTLAFLCICLHLLAVPK